MQSSEPNELPSGACSWPWRANMTGRACLLRLSTGRGFTFWASDGSPGLVDHLAVGLDLHGPFGSLAKKNAMMSFFWPFEAQRQ